MIRANTGISNAQKHDLIIKFNEERAMYQEEYEADKTMRKSQRPEEAKKDDGEYSKLNKKLGPRNNNKDVRQQLQEEVDMYTDN